MDIYRDVRSARKTPKARVKFVQDENALAGKRVVSKTPLKQVQTPRRVLGGKDTNLQGGTEFKTPAPTRFARKIEVKKDVVPVEEISDHSESSIEYCPPPEEPLPFSPEDDPIDFKKFANTFTHPQGSLSSLMHVKRPVIESPEFQPFDIDEDLLKALDSDESVEL
ncbi:hypothetical protein CANCADRAFT_46094 [Tortispora caseinolytica NRRL Y-17796]|uniref:Securin n=1 Tax=Tortispora caseinolytica NRRL Y-17796 TaxID=767744 RepID=A0A1E4TD43_9ASCO|nr:hypothetical protein CANCADRAFT_46094 [Tortispora caseinolytica NRRL Y-17796]